MKIHRNLLWLRGNLEIIELLLADRTLAPLVQSRPAPEIIAFRSKDHQRLVARLEKLGYTPRERGRW